MSFSIRKPILSGPVFLRIFSNSTIRCWQRLRAWHGKVARVGHCKWGHIFREDGIGEVVDTISLQRGLLQLLAALDHFPWVIWVSFWRIWCFVKDDWTHSSEWGHDCGAISFEVRSFPWSLWWGMWEVFRKVGLNRFHIWLDFVSDFYVLGFEVLIIRAESRDPAGRSLYALFRKSQKRALGSVRFARDWKRVIEREWSWQ